MTAFVVPLALFLAVVFAASALGKLRAADRGRGTFAVLRIPVPHAGVAAGVLIAVEGLVAIALAVTTGWLFVIATAAAALLTAGLLIAVVRGHRLGITDDCGCFGDWLPAAIGPRLIVRNAVLTAAAASLLIVAGATAAVAEPVGLPAAFSEASTLHTALGALGAAVLIAAGVWSIARATEQRSPVADAPSRGAGAMFLPSSAAIIDALAPGTRARLLVLVSPGCHACAEALDALARADAALRPLVDVYVVQRALRGGLPLEPGHPLPASARFAVDVGGSLTTLLGAGRATPVAALIGTDGAQAGPLARGSAEIDALLSSLLAVAGEPR